MLFFASMILNRVEPPREGASRLRAFVETVFRPLAASRSGAESLHPRAQLKKPRYFFFPAVPVFKRFGTAVSFGFSFFGFLASRLLRT